MSSGVCACNLRGLLQRSPPHGFNSQMGTIDFSVALRRTMDARGITQYELAKKSGVSQPAISQFLRGRRRNPGVELVSKLEDALGCRIYLEPEPPMKDHLEEFLKTQTGIDLGVTDEERERIMMRPWYPVGFRPTQQAWVDYIRAMRGLRADDSTVTHTDP